jgi:hypothetical protein
MRLTEIYEKCSHLGIFEERCVTDEFVELVFFNEDVTQWFNIISAIMGQPRKAQDEEPNATDLELTANTGSIRFEQTLFEKEMEEGTIIAKFWPWKDNVHTTLRMAMLLR